MKLERFCARCARENKRIKPEYLKSQGSPTYHPKKTALCPKHGIAMPLVLRIDDNKSINLVSMNIETQDVVEAFIDEIKPLVKAISDLEDVVKKMKKTRKKTT